MKQRFYSLDVFRGATVALIILVNNPGSWSYVYAPLERAPWHGCTPTDLVFPFFLFAVGNALAFTMPKLEGAGPTNIRILGVLLRIALAYLFASPILYYGRIRGALLAASTLLLGYWALCLLLGNAGDPYSLQGYFGTGIDKSILGAAHMYV